MPYNSNQNKNSSPKLPLKKQITSNLIITFALSVVYWVTFLVLSYNRLSDQALRGNLLGIGFILLFSYLLTAALANLLIIKYRNQKYQKELRDNLTKQTDDFPLGIFAKLKQPAALCDEDGTLVWMNAEFSERSPKNAVFSELSIQNLLVFSSYVNTGENTDADSTVPADVKELLSKSSQTKTGIKAAGNKALEGDWTVYVYDHKSNSNDYFLLVLTEDTLLNEWIDKYTDNRAVIAYLIIDNLGELVQSEQESYRHASTEVDSIIKGWSGENHAIIKEYERDKYVLIFTSDTLDKFCESEFDILEKVREIKIGSENLSVTISIGVSQSDGLPDEKEKSAQLALDMALQRGGNQAIVMTDSSPLFFGAKSLTSLKRSGVRHRVFADKLVHHIKKCSNVLIMSHHNADFDAIGSAAGIARLALSYDKITNIIVNENDPNLLECFEKLNNVPDYENIFVDKTEAQDLLNSDTLVICTDVNNPRQFEAPEVVKNADNLFIIDHHRQNDETPASVPGEKELLIVPSASSASELVSEILELGLPDNAKLHHEESDILFAGILLDTKQFTRNTQVPTFGAALYLRDNGADPVKAQLLFRTDIENFIQESSFGTDLEIYSDFIAIAKETSADASATKRIAAAKTADRLLNIKKIRASFVMAKLGNDVFISSRSDGSINVQLVMEQLGGGGHYNAAATLLKETSVPKAVELVKEKIDKYFSANNKFEKNVGKSKRRRKIKIKP